MYRNGQYVTGYTGTQFVSNTETLKLGKLEAIVGNSNNPYKGYLDEFAVYNRALSQAEIAAHYARTNASGSTGYCTSGAPADTTPPIITLVSPANQSTITTASTIMNVTTNETATCRYSTTAGVAYASMTNNFTTTGSTSHSVILSGLTNGVKNYSVRCIDAAGNNNTADYTITFTVALPSGGCPTGMVGYWKGDGSPADSSRRGHPVAFSWLSSRNRPS